MGEGRAFQVGRLKRQRLVVEASMGHVPATVWDSHLAGVLSLGAQRGGMKGRLEKP